MVDATLSIVKKGTQIPFEFCVNQYYVKENGRLVMKTMQSGVGVFAKTLEAYMAGIGSEMHMRKMIEEDGGLDW